MKRIITTGLSTLVGVAMFAGAAASAEKLKFAHVYEASHTHHKWAMWAADEIKKRTSGRYEVEVFPASTLGKESAINEGLDLGTVDIIYTGFSFAAKAYGPVAVAVAPFVWRDYSHWKAFPKSDVFKELADGYGKKTGHVMLAPIYYGARHVTSNKPIKSPADMKDMKIRVPDAPLMLMFPRSVGANPSPIAFNEVYLALQQGVVEAQENPLPTIQAKKFYEVQKYITLTGHMLDSQAIIVAGGRWAKLSDADKKTFREVYQDAAVKGGDDVDHSEQELVEWFRKQGITVNAIDKAPFIKMAEKAVYGPDATWPKEYYQRLQALK